MTMDTQGWIQEVFDREPTIDPDACEWCGSRDQCPDTCACPDCEQERALDEDADAYEDRVRDSLP